MNNTPIQQLVAQYAAEECNFSNIPGVIDASLRYVDSMPDSHVRCLLFTLANAHAAALERMEKLEKHAEEMYSDLDALRCGLGQVVSQFKSARDFRADFPKEPR